MTEATKKTAVHSAVNAHAKTAWKTAMSIHALAERPFEEVESSRLLAEFLQNEGFKVTFPFRNIPTAFRAEWGKGKPVIGFLGEYDALPNCGKEPGQWGHGCGHNLLGTAPALGAIAASEVMQAKKISGQVVYYGCPAEETLAGKVYMARDGAFRDLDACLCWHPSAHTEVRHYGGSAVDSIVFEFHGKTAHAASAMKGRSALDSVILLDVAANYLREHIPENVRIHSIIRDGGEAPNVVPGYASSWYYVRATNRAQVDHVRERLLACARGAAEATGTRMTWKRLTANYERLPNRTLSECLLKNLKLIRPPQVSAEDRKRLQKELSLEPIFDTSVKESFGKQSRASSDEDTVSWLSPLGRFNMLCHSVNTTAHHWDKTVQSAMPLAKRGMQQAAKVFAATAIDLCTNAKLMQSVRAEYKKQTKGFRFDPIIPKSQPVPKG